MGKLGGVIDMAKGRMDSWYNALTGLGTALRDKQTYTRFLPGARLSYVEQDALFHENDLAARICEALPEEALRKGYFLSSDETDQDLDSALDSYGKKIGFPKALKEAAIWARVFGGAVVYLGVQDGVVDEAEPVAMERIKAINFATVIDRRYIQPEEWYDDPVNDLKYGQPKTYRVSAVPSGAFLSDNLAGRVLHESRLIRLEGSLTSTTRMAQNRGWSDSALERADEVLTQFGSSWQGVTHLMQDAAQAVYKIKGLMDIMAGGDCAVMQSRMELVEMGRSVARAVVLDADSEDFDRVSYNFAGIPEILKLMIIRLAAAARMPVTVLMGQSPAGLNATGESDIRLWYDRVQAYQEEELAPAIERFWSLVFAAADFEGQVPQDYSAKFNRLWQMTDQEQADLEKAAAEKDRIYIDAGVLLPEEVALSRYTARGFSQETQIDLDARKEMLEAEIKLAKDQAGDPPILPPAMPGAQDILAEPEEDRQDGLRLDTIKHEGGKWVVYSLSGEKLGEHETEEEAKKQLRAIEASKHANAG